MLVFLVFISYFLGGLRSSVAEKQMNDLFWLMFIGFSGLWGIAFVIYAVGLRIYVNKMKFIVHGTEIVVIKGLINMTEKHVPYRTVTNISMRSSAPSLDQTAEEKLEGIIIYREIRDYILTQLRQFQKQEKVSAAEDQSVTPSMENIDQSELVGTLKEINVLLSKKFKILEEALQEISQQLKDRQKPY
jgi:hypothetical protein